MKLMEVGHDDNDIWILTMQRDVGIKCLAVISIIVFYPLSALKIFDLHYKADVRFLNCCLPMSDDYLRSSSCIPLKANEW